MRAVWNVYGMNHLPIPAFNKNPSSIPDLNDAYRRFGTGLQHLFRAFLAARGRTSCRDESEYNSDLHRLRGWRLS